MNEKRKVKKCMCESAMCRDKPMYEPSCQSDDDRAATTDDADVMASTSMLRREPRRNIPPAGIDRERLKDTQRRWHSLLPPPIVEPGTSEITRRPDSSARPDHRLFSRKCATTIFHNLLCERGNCTNAHQQLSIILLSGKLNIR